MFANGKGCDMDSKKLNDMMKVNAGTVKAFAAKVGVPYTTIRSSIASDDKLDRMPIANFIAIAHGFNMTADRLIEELRS